MLDELCSAASHSQATTHLIFGYFVMRGPRFSIRRLLIVTTICGLLLGLWGLRATHVRERNSVLHALTLGLTDDEMRSALTTSAFEHRHFQPNLQKWFAGVTARNEIIKVDFFNVAHMSHEYELIASCPSIEALSLASCEVTPDGLTTIAMRCPRLTVLNLSGTGATDEYAPIIGHFKNLQELDLSYNKITGRGLAILAASKLTKLEILDVSYTDITGADVTCLARIPSLRFLLLRGLKIPEDSMHLLQRALPKLTMGPKG